jgi:hypothetical protein
MHKETENLFLNFHLKMVIIYWDFKLVVVVVGAAAIISEVMSTWLP